MLLKAVPNTFITVDEFGRFKCYRKLHIRLSFRGSVELRYNYFKCYWELLVAFTTGEYSAGGKMCIAVAWIELSVSGCLRISLSVCKQIECT